MYKPKKSKAASALLSPIAPGHRICTRCGHELPLQLFDLFRKGRPQRRPDCRPCRTRADKLHRDLVKRKAAVRTMSDIHRLFTSHQDDKAVALAHGLVERFRGLDRFLRLVVEWTNSGEMPPSFRGKLSLV